MANWKSVKTFSCSLKSETKNAIFYQAVLGSRTVHYMFQKSGFSTSGFCGQLKNCENLFLFLEPQIKNEADYDRRNEHIPFVVAYYDFFAVKNLIDKCVRKYCGVSQLWIQIKSMSMCRTRDILRIQLKCNRPRYPLLWEAIVGNAQWLFSGFVLLLPSADRP